MDFISLLIPILCLLMLVYHYVQRKFKYWADKGVPFVEPEFFFGNIRGLNTKFGMAELLTKMYHKLKGKDVVGGIYFYTKPVCIPTNLDLIKNILVKDFNYFYDRGWYVNKEADILTGNLFSLQGADWKMMRSKLSPTFTTGKMKMMYSIFQRVVQDMIEYMDPIAQSRGQVDLRDCFAKYTTDIIADTAFGYENYSFKNPENSFRANGIKTFEMTNFEVMKINFLNAFPKIGNKFGIKFWKADVADFFSDMLKKTVAYREENNIKRNDFLSLLIQLKNSGKLDGDNVDLGHITFDELVAQAFVFFIAAFETSSTTMTYAIHELSFQPELQEKVREECFQVLEKNNGVFTYDSLNELTYLEQVIKETLRLYPVLDQLPRIATMDYKIPNTKHVIEKGTPIPIPIYAIQRDPEYYSDPDKFDPERFTPENIAKRHPMTWIPFGEGPRFCVGMRFGWVQMKLGLATIFTKYRFTPTSKTPSITFRPNSHLALPKEEMIFNISPI